MRRMMRRRFLDFLFRLRLNFILMLLGDFLKGLQFRTAVFHMHVLNLLFQFRF